VGSGATEKEEEEYLVSVGKYFVFSYYIFVNKFFRLVLFTLTSYFVHVIKESTYLCLFHCSNK